MLRLPHRARRRLPAAALSAVVTLTLGAGAATALSPDAGPAAGGTLVSGEVPGFAFADVRAGTLFTVGLSADGALYTWGQDTRGQLGDGTASSATATSPVRVDAPAGLTFTDVAAGHQHALALGSDGAVYAWGADGDGQLGDGGTTDAASPIRATLPAGSGVTDLAAGYGWSAALLADGRLLMWGSGSSGELGNGSTAASPTPVTVAMPAGVGVTALPSTSSQARHVLVLGSDGALYGWGSNADGVLGTGSAGGVQRTPVAVPPPSGVSFTAVAVGWNHSVALAADGAVYAWGRNAEGELGSGGYGSSITPAPVAADPAVTFVAVAAGANVSAALAADGTAYTWGYTTYGQMGDGTTGGSHLAPAPTAMPAGVRFTRVEPGGAQVAALADDGTAYTWGTGPAVGQAGTTPVLMPTALATSTTVEAVEFGGVPATGLSTSGAAWTAMAPGGCGPVDVTVRYRTLAGTLREQTTPAGFTYGTAPDITAQPRPATINAGDTAVLRVSTTGDPMPSVHWQIREPGGDSWTDVVGGTGDTVALSPTSAVEARAVASGCAGTAESDPALITVTAAPAPSHPTTPGSPAATAPGVDATSDGGAGTAATGTHLRGDGLAVTGTAVTASAIFAGILALVGVLLLAARRRVHTH